MQRIGDLTLERIINPPSIPDTAWPLPSKGGRPGEECPVCGNAGFVRAGVPFGHPLFGQLIECQECDTVWQRRMEALEEVSRWAEEMDGWTLKNLVMPPGADDEAKLEAARQVVKSFIKKPKGWLLLAGPCGSAKTHLLAAIRNGVGAHLCLYTVAEVLWQWLNGASWSMPYRAGAGYDPGEVMEIMARRMALARKVPILLLDELGAEAERSTEAVRARRMDLLGYRYDHKLPTAVATNAWPVQKLYGDEPGYDALRLIDRLTDKALVKVLEMPKYSFRQLER